MSPSATLRRTKRGRAFRSCGIVLGPFVGLAARAGAVFVSQTIYTVTPSRVVWAVLLLGERFSPFVWAAMGVMLVGLGLVQPWGRTLAVAEMPLS